MYITISLAPYLLHYYYYASHSLVIGIMQPASCPHHRLLVERGTSDKNSIDSSAK